MAEPVVAIFRSTRRAVCEERALVLAAVGIPGTIDFDPYGWVLNVEEADAVRALTQLALYDSEQRPSRPRAPPHHYPGAWLGCMVYVLVLVGVAGAISRGLWRLDAFRTGELDAGSVQAGQWWRAWTALTLHVGPEHLLGNLGAGVWFGYLVSRQIGPGSAWFLVVTGAALANLIEALTGPPTHSAVGASTAVFTALGLMAAYSWRTRLEYPQRWAVRWAPLVAGLALLAWTGAGDASGTDGTDLVGHALGFMVGLLCGLAAAPPRLASWLRRIPQWIPALGALVSLAVAWSLALAS
jgi:rhomboid protease GluP